MKRLITILIIVILLVIAFLSYLFIFRDNDVKRNNESKKAIVDDSYINTYKNYLRDTFLSTGRSDIGEVQARFMGFDDEEPPMLIIKYNKNINVLRINKNKTVDIKKISKANLAYLYDIKEDSGDFYVVNPYEEHNNYQLIKTLFDKKPVTVKDFVKDEKYTMINFSSRYVIYDVDISYYDLTMEVLNEDLERLLDHYETDEPIISDVVISRNSKKVEEKEKMQLKADDSGIYNSYHRISYGQYISKYERITINKDLLCEYDYEASKPIHLEGKCGLYGNLLVIESRIFEINNDNKISSPAGDLTLRLE